MARLNKVLQSSDEHPCDQSSYLGPTTPPVSPSRPTHDCQRLLLTADTARP
eukprot:m.762706 g.762706  ORF g.762706 m.762706 type:complete len:51 (-) comp23211_c0_seq5:1563-1715(-)